MTLTAGHYHCAYSTLLTPASRIAGAAREGRTPGAESCWNRRRIGATKWTREDERGVTPTVRPNYPHTRTRVSGGCRRASAPQRDLTPATALSRANGFIFVCLPASESSGALFIYF